MDILVLHTLYIQEQFSNSSNSAHIIVDEGDLDTIADYILDGKHEQLTGIKSDSPEVQDFLDKIPFYVVCIY